MKRAQSRDAVHRETFYFRKSVVPEDDKEEEQGGDTHPRSHDNEYTLMSIDTIINGNVCYYDAPVYYCAFQYTIILSGP